MSGTVQIDAIDSVSGNPGPLKKVGDALKVTPVMSGASTLVALGATTKVVAMTGYPIPSTMTLKSVDATRRIEFSVDGGFEYFQPSYDVTSATMLVAVANAGLSHVKFTGLTTDTWSIS